MLAKIGRRVYDAMPSRAGARAFQSHMSGVTASAPSVPKANSLARHGSFAKTVAEPADARRAAHMNAGRKRAGELYDASYSQQRKKFIKTGAGAGAYLAMMEASNGRGKTSANQNTFARNAMLGRNTVGISSGALQEFDASRRALGGL